MNKIVLEHYPASRLPDDVRGEIDLEATVTLTIVEEVADRPRQSLTEIINEYRRDHKPTFQSSDDIVAYVRALRDGGDLGRWLDSDSTSTPTS